MNANTNSKTVGINEQSAKPGFAGYILRAAIPFLIIFAFIIASNVLKSMKKRPEIKKRKPPILSVLTTPAVTETVQLKIIVQGESQPRTEIDFVPEVAGKIVFVSPKFLTGGLFKKGDVLYRIEDADYQVSVVKAGAAVARAQQVLVRERAESDIARRDWEDLGEGRRASNLTLRKPQLLEAQANLQSAQSDLDNARLRQSRTNVVAPFDGRVREKYADIGQYVNPGARLGRIFSTDIAEIKLALSDADLARLDLPIAYIAKNRASAPNVLLSARIGGKTREWHGNIMRTAASYDPKTRSLFALVEVVDPYGKGKAAGGYPLAPGLFVDAEISGKTLGDVIIIPRDGLRPEQKVYVVSQDGSAKSIDVDVLDTNMDRAVIGSGIEEGDLVIVAPLEKSQLQAQFKALDLNDPTLVLAEPTIEDVKKPEVKLTAKQLKKQKKLNAKIRILEKQVKKLKAMRDGDKSGHDKQAKKPQGPPAGVDGR